MFTSVLVVFVLLGLQFYVYVLQIVVCPFVLFLLAIVLSVLLRFTDSDYLFGIFKLFLIVSEIIFFCYFNIVIQSLQTLLKLSQQHHWCHQQCRNCSIFRSIRTHPRSLVWSVLLIRQHSVQYFVDQFSHYLFFNIQGSSCPSVHGV